MRRQELARWIRLVAQAEAQERLSLLSVQERLYALAAEARALEAHYDATTVEGLASAERLRAIDAVREDLQRLVAQRRTALGRATDAAQAIGQALARRHGERRALERWLLATVHEQDRHEARGLDDLYLARRAARGSGPCEP